MRVRRLVLGASWAMIAALALLAWRGWAAPAPDQLVAEYQDLFGRCLHSIETRQPLNMTGLARMQAPDDTAFENLRKFRLPGGRLAIVEGEYPKPDGVRRVCKITLADENTPYTDRARVDLLLAFLRLREAAIQSGAYQPKQLEYLPGLPMLAFTAKAPNAAGCTMIATLAVSLTDRLLLSSVGEQALPDTCQGPSLIRANDTR